MAKRSEDSGSVTINSIAGPAVYFPGTKKKEKIYIKIPDYCYYY